ncbi:MAG: ASKHA domain-containing protein [Thermodesulfobacteriota bacterium]
MKKPKKKKHRKKSSIGSRSRAKQKRKYFYVNILPNDLWLKVRQGQSVWQAFQKAGIELGECGGLGKCGKCKVKIISPVGALTESERYWLDEEEVEEGIRLACRTTVDKDLVVYRPEPESEMEFSQVLQTGYMPHFEINPLLNQRVVSLSSIPQDEGISDLDRVKRALGPEYAELKSSLHCLRNLPRMLQDSRFRGAAVLHGERLMTWQKLEEMQAIYGLVFDLGTTTLVGKLFNLLDGKELAVVSCFNNQSKYGKDVIARQQYIKEHPNGLENLYQILVDDLNHLTARLLKTTSLCQDDVFIAVAAGNTTMQHLLLKLDPTGIAEAPFAPVLTDGVIVSAADVGLQLNPEALFYMMPVKSGYIGGDLMSVILASGAAEQDEEIILALDLGTNGEIFLGSRRRLMTCSTAAGPALEGARISRGMIAASGAIEAVYFEEGELHYQVIGNIKPKGICGSGLVELVAVLLELDVIDSDGLIRVPQGQVAETLSSRVIPDPSGVNKFLVASPEESGDGKPIYLTQQDVRELQLAKGAIAAGIKILMDDMGVGTEDIGYVYLAGALGNYVNPDSAMRIGLIPEVDRGSISSLGNAASTGASMVLLSKEYWKMAGELGKLVEHVELSSRLDFNEYFVEQIDFPRGKLLDIYREEAENEMMKVIKVGEVMTSDFPTVSPHMSLEEFRQRLRDTGHHGFPILDEEGCLYGCATVADLERSVQSGHPYLTVGDIATTELFIAYPDQSLYDVLHAANKDYGRIPVVARDNQSRLTGVLRRHDMMKAYRRILERAEEKLHGQ